MDASQLIRWFMMAGSGVLVGASFVIVWYYARQWVRRARAGLKGTIPLRVILTVVSYDLLLVSSVIAQVTRFDEQAGLSWRVFLVVPSIVIGLAVLAVILFTDRGPRNDDPV